MRNSAYLILLLFLFSPCIVNGQEKTYSSRYNLDFDNFNDSIITWYPYIIQNTMEIDSSVVYNNKHPLKIYTRGKQLGLNTHLVQRVLLPDIKHDSIEVRLTFKSKNIDNPQLIIDRISEDEKTFIADTLNMHSEDTTWRRTSYKFPSLNMKYIEFNLIVKCYSNKNDKAFLLDRLDILIDGRPIDTFTLPTIPSFSVMQPEGIKKLSLKEDLYANIPQLKTKKIVALGETVHGSAPINEITAQIIKHQILENNCKLVLLEFPFEIMMFVNKEMQGESEFKGDSIIKSFEPLLDYEVLDNLISWIRQYNEEHSDNPVILMGTDISTIESENHKLLSKYIICLNQTNNEELLNDFSALLSKSTYKTTTAALDYLEKHPEIEEVLSPTDYLLIKHNLDMSYKATPSPVLRLIHTRDIIMKDNSAFLIDLFAPDDKKVTIWTHFQHANYHTVFAEFPIASFGSHMKELYADQYSCLGVLIGGGEITASTHNEMKVTRKVLSSPENSMEYYFNRRTEDFLYGSSLYFNESISYIRAITQPYSEVNQFILINPKARMDGVIFIKESNTSLQENESKL